MGKRQETVAFHLLFLKISCTFNFFLIVKQKRDTSCVKFQINKRGRKSVLSEKDLSDISDLIDSNPDITINGIIKKLGLKATNETIRKVVIKMGYKYIKSHCTLQNVNVPSVEWKRKNWIENLPGYDKNNLV